MWIKTFDNKIINSEHVIDFQVKKTQSDFILIAELARYGEITIDTFKSENGAYGYIQNLFDQLNNTVQRNFISNLISKIDKTSDKNKSKFDYSFSWLKSSDKPADNPQDTPNTQDTSDTKEKEKPLHKGETLIDGIAL